MFKVKHPNRLSFYTNFYFLLPFTLILLMGFGMVSFAQAIYHDSQYDAISFGNHDLCQQRALIDIAQKYVLKYQLSHDYGFPNVMVTGKKEVIAQVRQEFEKLYPPATAENGYATVEPTKQCHLINVKNNVPNINAKLLPYIPNDVDYVSYSPTEDKAVYCYYHFQLFGIEADKNSKIGSQCSFIQLSKNSYGKEALENYDISDMERANLSQLAELWHINKQPSEFYGVYSYVTKWENSPTHYFGFNLATPYEGNRWGGYGEY